MTNVPVSTEAERAVPRDAGDGGAASRARTTPSPPSVGPALDAAAWDRWVASTSLGSYLQQTAWASVKAANGWSSVRLAADAGEAGRIGLQVLARRPRPMPWAFAYAPRGPVADDWTGASIEALTDLARERLGHGLPGTGRVSHLRIDPEIERGGPLDADGSLRSSLRRAGWRPAPAVQPGSTRVIDLTADEQALWSGLRKKWRQYVNKARNQGVRVVDADGSRLADFYRIYRETAERAGFLIRTEETYRRTWQAFAASGGARLLFAEAPDGEPLATLFLLSCGPRVVEPYGGMTAAGAESRANYLLKWEAIRSSRERAMTSYDLWGLAHPGIAHFKSGFGGREVHYVGAWDLVLDPAGRLAYDAGQRARVWLARRRHGIAGGTSASEFDGAGGAA